MQALESKLQSKIIRYLKKNGWFVRKILATNCPGDPDIYSYKDGMTIWIEVKREGKTARPLQLYRHEEIRNSGMQCYVLDTWAAFLNIIE